MAEKRYILKTMDQADARFAGGNGNRPIEQNLLNLSTLGIKWNTSLIKQIRSDVIYSDDSVNQIGGVNTAMFTGDDEFLRSYSNISGQNDFIAFYDQTYQMRRDFLRRFALQSEIDYVLETIADEVIINDDMHYFAYPNTKQLKSILKPEKGAEIVDGLFEAYRHVYHMFHFNEGNDAWHYVKKFLVDGFLAFEIIYSDDKNNNAKDIIGFTELDPIRLQPQIKVDPKTGKEYKVWILNKGDATNERELPDTNVIYISWAKNNFISHLSYCERLIRSFNMLRTIENSRIIWNIQNAQKRIKIVVPVGGEALQRQKTRLRELEAQYKEDISIDNMSGEITVNGQPKFSFAKNFIFPSKDGTSTEIGEIDVAGHDLNSTEQLKWFWQRFMIETKLPKDRFNMLFDGQEQSSIPDANNMTREEYRFSLFIGRIRDIFKELLIKPMWIQFCLKYPMFANNNILKNALGLEFIEENIFTLAKEDANLRVSANIIQTLSGLHDNAGKPVFSTRFLMQRYMNMTDDDLELNKQMLKEDEELAKSQGKQTQTADAGLADMGLGGDMNAPITGGFDMGGGEMPVEPETPAEEPVPEPAAEPATETPAI